MNEILASHVIEPVFFRNDNFKEFFETRKKAILKRIEKAMSKPVIHWGEEQ